MEARGSREISVVAEPFTIGTAELRKGLSVTGAQESRILVWHWYWINGRMTSNAYLAKLYLVQSRLLGQGDDSAMIALYAPLDGQDAEAALGSFVRDGGAAIASALEQTRKMRGVP